MNSSQYQYSSNIFNRPNTSYVHGGGHGQFSGMESGMNDEINQSIQFNQNQLSVQ